MDSGIFKVVFQYTGTSEREHWHCKLYNSAEVLVSIGHGDTRPNALLMAANHWADR